MLYVYKSILCFVDDECYYFKYSICSIVIILVFLLMNIVGMKFVEDFEN